ncbi:hypothetical protein DPMN_020325 [Dreissena polymorpha]|uniref:Uncharacterized protein n=1 Tax=Dreissena polymorpha TaxID=45954 RepID=A0A9D4NGL2_DREPO|nr:hypothetical protein DPMN_020325 [Dreissena polymorpha]
MGLLYQSSGIKMGHILEVSAEHPYPKLWEVTPPPGDTLVQLGNQLRTRTSSGTLRIYIAGTKTV